MKDDGIPVNYARFADKGTRTFSFMHTADGVAEAAGTELCNGKRLVDGPHVEEIAVVELDCAGTYPLTM